MRYWIFTKPKKGKRWGLLAKTMIYRVAKEKADKAKKSGFHVKIVDIVKEGHRR